MTDACSHCFYKHLNDLGIRTKNPIELGQFISNDD